MQVFNLQGDLQIPLDFPIKTFFPLFKGHAMTAGLTTANKDVEVTIVLLIRKGGRLTIKGLLMINCFLLPLFHETSD